MDKKYYWLLIFGIFWIGFFVGVGYILNTSVSELDIELKYDANYKKRIEEKIGTTCEDLYQSTKLFLKEKIEPIIDFARKGGSWLSLSSPQLISEIKELENKTLECSIMNSNIDKDGIKSGLGKKRDFEKLDRLLAGLESFLFLDNEIDPSIIKLDITSFEKIDNDLKEILVE